MKYYLKAQYLYYNNYYKNNLKKILIKCLKKS